jgi:hypothetical protein
MKPIGRASVAWAAVLTLGAACLPPTEADESIARQPEAPAVAMAWAAPVPTPPAAEDDAAVVLVVLDGVRWQDVFVGADPHLVSGAAPSAAALMPHLHALVAERGAAVGAPGRGPAMSASGPNFVSLPGYTEILHGRRTHACGDNDCAATLTPTVFDEAAAASPGKVAFFSSWERLDRAASARPQSLVLSTGRTRVWQGEQLASDPEMRDWLDRGAAADPAPGWGEFRPDRFTAALALKYLERRHPKLMFLGLGEPDEYGHHGDYRGYLASLRACDAVLGDLVATLDRMGDRGAHTTVLVTADHGRGRDWRHHGLEFPESGRVWLVATGASVKARGLVSATRKHRLADVAPTIRQLLDLAPDMATTAGAPLDELLDAGPLATAALSP